MTTLETMTDAQLRAAERRAGQAVADANARQRAVHDELHRRTHVDGQRCVAGARCPDGGRA